MKNSDSEIDHIKNLIVTHKLNLYELEEKSAKFGINIQPDLINAIRYETEQIQALESRLKNLKQGNEIFIENYLATIRQVINQASTFITNNQRPEGTWLRNDLFPTARSLFFLLVSGSDIKEIYFQRSIKWIIEHLNDRREKPDAIAMGLIAINEARKLLGLEIQLDDIIKSLLQNQQSDGSWEGRYPISRYYAYSTAFCFQALRSYGQFSKINDVFSACYDGEQFIRRYFRSINFNNFTYNEITNVVETLLLPHYEAWGLIESIPEIKYATKIMKGRLGNFKELGNIKGVAGILNLLLTEWENFDEESIRDSINWLTQVRNPDFGWTEHVGEQSEPHHSAIIGLPIRQSERIGDHYIPLFDINDYWSLPAEAKSFNKELSVSVVLFRKLLNKFEILLLQRHDGTWVLPKGHIEQGEVAEEALIREIREETGLSKIILLERLGEKNYIFRINSDKINKKVEYFLGRSGANNNNIPTPDDAHIKARWFPVKDIYHIPLYYDDSRQILSKAIRLLEKEIE